MKTAQEIGQELGAVHGVEIAPEDVCAVAGEVSHACLMTSIETIRGTVPGVRLTNAALLIINDALALLCAVDETAACEAVALLALARKASMVTNDEALAECLGRQTLEAQMRLHFIEVSRFSGKAKT